MDIPILYHGGGFVVCLKPVGVESEAAGMPLLLSRQLRIPEVLCVHRLDKAVGGVMVYALDRDSAAALSRQIGDGRFEKEYLAVIHGEMNEAEAELRDLLFHDRARNKSYAVTRKRAGVKEAVLDYRALQAAGACSLLSVRLRTGRTHQIRVQFASRGHPLVGDAKYGSPRRDCPVALYSHRLAFAHPVTDEVLSFTAPPPGGYPWSLFSI
ncbi:MAG: RluA family pseudouridine synthase [Oscillospiraceae bacterium]|nr:RluA family pseudouridine synthase [Oscillospiraceae bacterium]